MPDPNNLCIRLNSDGTYSVHDFDDPPKEYTERPFPIRKNGLLHFSVPSACGVYGVAVVGRDSEGPGVNGPKNPGVVFLAGSACTSGGNDPSALRVRKEKTTPAGEGIQISLFCLRSDGTVWPPDTAGPEVIGGPRMKVVA